MTSIRDLSSTTAVASGDLIPIASAANGVDLKMSVAQLLTYFGSAFASPTFTVQTGAPLSGATQTIGAVTTNIWLQIRPAGTIASLTIALPSTTSAFDGQQVIVTTSQNISAITVTSGGAAVIGEPATLSAESAFILRYDLAALQWICVAQSFKPDFVAQTTAPTTTGFTFTVTDSASNIWAKINGTGNFAAGTVNLPAASSSFDGQEIVVTTLQNINTITWASSGATIFGAPTGLGANGMARFRYETSILRWTVIGVVREQPLRSTSIGVLVSELPSAVSNRGARSFVTDSNVVALGNFGNTVNTGGANVVPVYSDGSSWKIG